MLFDFLIASIVVICVILSISRGFMKEFFALIFFLLSVFLTTIYYDFFTVNYSKYFDTKTIQNIFSAISVFMIFNLVFMVINNWLMYILSPIRLGLIDRLTGITIGVLRGILFSYILFFAVHLYCHTIYNKDDKKEQQYQKEEEFRKDTESTSLPYWIKSSYFYKALFSIMEDAIDLYIPESIILRIKEIGEELINQEELEILKNSRKKSYLPD